MDVVSEIVNVTLAGARGYRIHIGSNLLDSAVDCIAAALPPGRRRCIIVTDSNVAPLYADPLYHTLHKAGLCQDLPIMLPAGEKTKNFAMLEWLLQQILGRGIDRKTLLVALGGGVVGDITGFAAAIALRGIDFIQIPTTLLAQVDSAVGGKTGINTEVGKNLVGAFHQPRLVLADVGTLQSLPPRQVQAGYGEIVKYGLLGDAGFFQWLEQHGGAVLAGDRAAQIHAIKTSCQMKAAIVAGDEQEQGTRALLNLGHTFAHACETASHYDGTLLHGEAVALGCVLAFELSLRLGLCEAGAVARLRTHLAACGLPTTLAGYGWNPTDLLAHMYKDKKTQGNALTFILARSIGTGFIAHNVAPADVLAVLAESCQHRLPGDKPEMH